MIRSSSNILVDSYFKLNRTSEALEIMGEKRSPLDPKNKNLANKIERTKATNRQTDHQPRRIQPSDLGVLAMNMSDYPTTVAAQDDVGGAHGLLCGSSYPDHRHGDFGRAPISLVFSNRFLIPGGHGSDSDLSAGPAGDENVSGNAQSHQGGCSAFLPIRFFFFRPRWIGCVALFSDHLDTKCEFSPGKSLLITERAPRLTL